MKYKEYSILTTTVPVFLGKSNVAIVKVAVPYPALPMPSISLNNIEKVMNSILLDILIKNLSMQLLHVLKCITCTYPNKRIDPPTRKAPEMTINLKPI